MRNSAKSKKCQTGGRQRKALILKTHAKIYDQADIYMHLHGDNRTRIQSLQQSERLFYDLSNNCKVLYCYGLALQEHYKQKSHFPQSPCRSN